MVIIREADPDPFSLPRSLAIRGRDYLEDEQKITPLNYKTFTPGYDEYLIGVLGDSDLLLSRALDLGLGLFRIALPCPESERLSQPRCELAPFELALMMCRGVCLDEDDLELYARSKLHEPPAGEIENLGGAALILAFNKDFITSVAAKYGFVYSENPFMNARDSYWQTTSSPAMWTVLHALAARTAISSMAPASTDGLFWKKFDLLLATLVRNLDMFILCGMCKEHYRRNVLLIPFREEVFLNKAYKAFVAPEPDRELVKLHALVNSTAMINRSPDASRVDVDEFVRFYRYCAGLLSRGREAKDAQ